MTTPPRMSGERRAQLLGVVEDVLSRRRAGEVVDVAGVCRKFAHLEPELRARLGMLDMVVRADAEAACRSGSATGDGVWLDASVDGGEAGEGTSGASLPSLEGYRVVAKVGAGGQGVVYDAVHRGTGRRVAIKFVHLPSRGDGGHELARFRREVIALGSLRHPNIAGVLGSGVHDGRPYCVLDFIDGSPLDEYVLAASPTAERTVRMFVKIASALQEAHLRGVIHRDLKPGNVLVDDGGEPHVVDFGLALLVQEVWGHHSIADTLTHSGQFVGSLRWASPEQAGGGEEAGGAAGVDVRSDLYSLGVMLYESLTGEPPYELTGTLSNRLRIVQFVPPKRLAGGKGGVGADLEAVVLRCMAKQPGERYQSARELGEDLTRWLERRPVLARAPSVWSAARSAALRNKPLMFGCAAVVGALAIGLATTGWQLRRAVQAEGAANTERDRAEFQAYASGIALAEGAIESPERRSDAVKALRAAPERPRGWEWGYLMATADRSLGVFGDGVPVQTFQCSGDGRFVVRVHEDGTIDMMGAEGGEARWTRRAGFKSSNYVGLSRDGARVVVSSRGREVVLLDGADGREVHRWGFGGERVADCAVAPANRGRAVFAAFDATGEGGRGRPQLRRYADDRDEPVWSVDLSLEDGGPCRLAVSPDDGLLYLSRGSSILTVYEAATGKETRSWRVPGAFDGEWTCLALSGDGRVLAVSLGTELHLFHVPDGTLLRTLRGHTQSLTVLAFSPDGKSLVSGSFDHTLRVWDVAGDRPPLVLTGETSACGGYFLADGGHLVSHSADLSCRLWSVRTRPPVQRFELGEAGSAWYAGPVVFDGGGRGVWAFCKSEAARVDLATGAIAREEYPWASTHGGKPAMDPERRIVYWYDPTPDDRGLFTLGAWSIDTHKLVWKLSEPVARCALVRLSPGGERVVYLVGATTARLVEAATGRVLFDIDCAPGRISAMSFDKGTGNLVTGTYEGSLSVWDGRTGRRIADLPGTRAGLSALAISPDGSFLAAAFGDRGVIGAWSLRTRQRLADFGSSGSTVTTLAFNPDGGRLAVGTTDRIIHLWHVGMRTELLRLRGHSDQVEDLAWSGDGRFLASIGRDDRLVLWDSRGAAEQAEGEGN